MPGTATLAVNLVITVICFITAFSCKYTNLIRSVVTIYMNLTIGYSVQNGVLDEENLKSEL